MDRTSTPEIQSPSTAAASTLNGEVEFRNLSYAYPGTTEPVLQGISLKIPAGSTLGLLGRTGSGKSTLVNLIPRLLDSPDGTLFIDGVDVRSMDLQNLRSQIGMVPQDTFLFSSTIKENIGFGREEMTGEEVRHLQELSTISRDLSTFPEGNNTTVGERGVTLSGGQKQRIALSRAMAINPRIVILDDTFSAVDTETEESILSGLLEDISGRTTILVSHRVSTLKYAHRIAVMEDGRLSQYGSHQELVGQEGFYRQIYEIQKLEDRLEERV